MVSTNTIRDPQLEQIVGSENWRATEGGLVVPSWVSEDEATAGSDVKEVNRELIKIYTSRDLPSLENSFLDLLTSLTKYEDENGVIRYKNVKDLDSDEIADGIMSNLKYHVNHRHYNLPSNVLEAVETQGPDGISYADRVVQSLTGGVSKDFVKQTLEDSGKSIETVLKLGDQVANTYLNIQVSEILTRSFESNPTKMLTGLANLNAEHHIAPGLQLDRLKNAGVKQIGETYLGLLRQYWKN